MFAVVVVGSGCMMGQFCGCCCWLGIGEQAEAGHDLEPVVIQPGITCSRPHGP